MNDRPVIERRINGEYSTVRLPHDGAIETCWFPDDPDMPSQVIGRSYGPSVAQAASEHITEWEAREA